MFPPHRCTALALARDDIGSRNLRSVSFSFVRLAVVQKSTIFFRFLVVFFLFVLVLLININILVNILVNILINILVNILDIITIITIIDIIDIIDNTSSIITANNNVAVGDIVGLANGRSIFNNNLGRT